MTNLCSIIIYLRGVIARYGIDIEWCLLRFWRAANDSKCLWFQLPTFNMVASNNV